METGANNILITVTGEEESVCGPLTIPDNATIPEISEDGVIIINHNQVAGIQGGLRTERYHVSKDIYDAVNIEGVDATNTFVSEEQLEQEFVATSITVNTHADMLAAAIGSRVKTIFVTEESIYNEPNEFFTYYPSKGVAYLGIDFNYAE